MRKKHLLILGTILTLFAICIPYILAQNTTTHIGKGCTTLTYFDYDCDGYVIGGKDGHVGIYTNINFPPSLNLEADANDNDYEVNTFASAEAKYGIFTDMNNFKNYLNDIGYTHTINNVFFISLTGNDSTGQPNNINLPYRNIPRPVVLAGVEEHLIKAGDVVVFRGGEWQAGSLSTLGSQSWVPGIGTYDIGLNGTSTNPILFITAPGERVIIQGHGGGTTFGPTVGTTYVIIDGFEFDGTDPNTGNIVANDIFRIQGISSHITFRNIELRNAQTWGIFGVLEKDRDYYTFDKINIHHIRDQHCIYRNDISSLTELDTDFGWVIKNSIFYNCGLNGIQWRGGKNSTFDGNIIHSTGLNGIDLKNSPEDVLLNNNLFFNNGNSPIMIFEDNDPQRWAANGSNNILITNNIFAGHTGFTGVSSDASSYPAIRLTHITQPPRTHKNIQIYNNIIYSIGTTPIYFDYFPDIAETKIEKNIFYRVDSSGVNNLGGMSVFNWTDGTHNHVESLFGLPLYIWNFESMQSMNRPQFKDNLFANPLFANVSNLYTTGLTPWLFDFSPTQNSPSIDFSLSQYSSLFDLKGKSRNGLADTGSYEYNGGSTTGGSSSGGTTSGGTTSSGGSRGGSSGSGGSSGGSGSSTSGNTNGNIIVAQCSDGVDNDGDKKIDYSQDEGCLSYNDDNELNIDSIQDAEEFSDKGSIVFESQNGFLEARFILSFILAMLIIAILFVILIIIRNVRVHKRFRKLTPYY